MSSYVEYQCIYLHYQNPGIFCYNATNNRQQECGSLRFHLLLFGQAVEPAFKLPLICNAMVLMSRPCIDSEFCVLFRRKCRGKNKRCGWCSHSPWRSCGVTVMVMLYISHLMRSGIIYSIWLCGQIENVDVYFSWPENTLEQTADQAVILDPPLLSYFWQNCVEVVP